jgi:transposase
MKYDSRKLKLLEKEFLRKRAVASVIEDGLSQTESARLHKVSNVSLCNWIKKYKSQGIHP